MAKIASFPVLNFSGGVRRDKSPFQIRRNELLDARNVLIDDTGRIRVRRGSQQVGNTLSGNITDSFYFIRDIAGGSPVGSFIVNNNASTAVFRRLVGMRLTTNITTASTTCDVTNAAALAAPTSNIEIDGDIIEYTARAGNTLTITASTINSAHSSGAAVHQWGTMSAAVALDGQMGVYYATLNNILIVNTAGGVWNQIDNNDALTMTSLAATEPGGIFITNYRDRLFVAGDGSSGTTNSDEDRVSFSARGDGVSASAWTSTDFFDVEDQRAEPITGFLVKDDRLWIFKYNSMFSYDEIELKRRQTHVGAWNQKVVQELNGLIYTFCPEGIFETNGFQSKQIGDPVKQYWKNFHPRYDATGILRVVVNTFAGKYENHYWLYIHDITDPDSTNDVVLDYDINKKAWTVHTGGFTNFFHFGSFQRFEFGDSDERMLRTALFAGNDSGQYFRFFENRYIDNQATPAVQGTDIFEDLRSNTGTPVSAVIETPLYDMTHPNLYKSFRNFRGYAEQGIWHVEYRVESEGLIGPYRPLGTIDRTVKVLPFPHEAEGTRVGFRITNATTAHSGIFNGFVIEDTEVTGKDA